MNTTEYTIRKDHPVSQEKLLLKNKKLYLMKISFEEF